jgi:hypothetical protein
VLLSNLRSAIRDAHKAGRRRAVLHNVIVQALGDSMRNRDEPEKIDLRLKSLGIAPVDLRPFGAAAFSAVLKAIEEDGRLSPNEERTLYFIAHRFGIPVKTVVRALHRLSKARLRYDIEHGGPPSIEVPGLMLLKGEVAHWSEPASIIDEHTGNGARDPARDWKDAAPVSRGALVLTNQRLIFDGDKRSMDAPWDKISNVGFYGNGIRLSRTGRSSTTFIKFDFPGNADMIVKIISHINRSSSPSQILNSHRNPVSSS